MPRRILILDGHPDPDPARLIHGLAGACAEGADDAGHEVRRVDLAALDVPLLSGAEEFHGEDLPEAAAALQADIAWAEHAVILFPLWMGGMPARLKGLVEQTFRPGFAMDYSGRFPKGRLKGRSARIVVTMGMPALAYRLWYRAHALKALERNILRFVGFAPVRSVR